MTEGGLFASFFMAGFECSSHRRRDGLRLDLIRASAHDTHAFSDYRRCADLGLVTLRDGLRWHLIETAPGVYDWSTWRPMVRAARAAGVRIVWDMFHYGWPDHLDIGSPEIVDAFARFCAEAVRVHVEETGEAPLACPVNEISFFTWAVKNRYFPPIDGRHPQWVKRQLIRCALAAVEAMRAVDPGCRFVWAEPLVHVAPHGGFERRKAEANRQLQFQVYDLLLGLREPDFGGGPHAVDAIGLNFYPHNQWYWPDGPTIPMGHHEYRPLADMLCEVAQRYGKPIFIAETGAEGSGRPAWLHYVCDEVGEAQARGADIRGVCLYPITAYPGWDNERHCEVGLFSSVLAGGERKLHAPLAEELQRQRRRFEPAEAAPDLRLASA
jgi:hypothetical protein